MRSAPFGRGVKDNLREVFKHDFKRGFWCLFGCLVVFECWNLFGVGVGCFIVFDAV